MSDIRSDVPPASPGLRRRPPAPHLLLGLGAAALTAAACTLAAGSGAATAAGPRAAEAATSSLVDLTLAPAPPLGLSAFHGRYGHASSAPDGGPDGGDFSDPSGVLSHLTVIGAVTARTDAGPGKTSAQAQAGGFTLGLNSKDFVSVGSLDAYAECVPPPVGPYALAYARTDGGVIDVLGHTVPVGTTTFDVTGAEIGASGIGGGTLTVTYEPYQHPPGGAPTAATSADAGVDITVSGTFTDTSGAPAYAGPLVDLRLGHVAVTCETTTPTPTNSVDSTTPVPPTTTPPTTATTTPTTPTPTGPETGGTTPPPTTPPTTSPTTPPTTSPDPSGTAGTTPPPTPTGTWTTPGGDTLPHTGAEVGWAAGLAGGSLLLGGFLVFRTARARRGRHL
ncbi:LPXTG cell wall anchor domain-containing protein [Streptomyces sp. NPDC008079]|uniref:LPXTG cell wall anchor domain-containing protein n=1 Tax=Streptomyces sp. NPDC008079 TaxID=3364806 RepID=UPI0036E4AB9E